MLLGSQLDLSSWPPPEVCGSPWLQDESVRHSTGEEQMNSGHGTALNSHPPAFIPQNWDCGCGPPHPVLSVLEI